MEHGENNNMAQEHTTENDALPLDHDAAVEAILDAAPWETASTDYLLPEVSYLFECSDISGSKNANSGKIQITAVIEVLQPLEYAGRSFYQYYTIGTDNDPEAQKPQTWDASAGAGIAIVHRLRQVTDSPKWREIKSKRFMGQIQITASQDGRKFQNIINIAREGELNLGVPTPPRKVTQRRSGIGANSGGLNSNASPSGDVPVPCMACGQTFTQATLAEHSKTCTGTNQVSA